MIPKTLVFDLAVENQSVTKDDEIEVKIASNTVAIYDGESTVILSLEQLYKIGEVCQQVSLMKQKAFATKPESLSKPTAKPVKPPLNALDALKARDEMVSRLFVVGCEGSYYPANAKPGEAIEFVNRVALAKLFESSEAAFEVAQKFSNSQVYPFSTSGNYRIVIPQPDGTLSYYNGLGKASNHVNDSIQITGRENALRTAKQYPEAFLLPVTD